MPKQLDVTANRCRSSGMSQQMAVKATGVSKQTDVTEMAVKAMGCRAEQLDATASGCPSNGMSQHTDVTANGCQNNGTTKQWDVKAQGRERK